MCQQVTQLHDKYYDDDDDGDGDDSVNQYLLLHFNALLLVLGFGTSDMTCFLIEYLYFLWHISLTQA
jgi:hypothetical protein